MSKWTDFVKKWASEKNVSYGCALSKPQCSADYRKKNPKPLTKKQQNEERSGMSKEDINVADKDADKQRKERIEMGKEDVNIAEKRIKVRRIKIRGVIYLIDANNILYDEKTQTPEGLLNRKTNKIEDLPDEYYETESEDEEEKAKKKAKAEKKAKAKAKAKEKINKLDKLNKLKFRQNTLNLPFDMKKEILSFLPSFTKKDRDKLFIISKRGLDFHYGIMDHADYFNLEEDGRLLGKRLEKRISVIQDKINPLMTKIEKILEKNGIEYNDEDLKYDSSDYEYIDDQKAGIYSEGEGVRIDKKEFKEYLDLMEEWLVEWAKEINEIDNLQLSMFPIE
jgi:hypothetical protein